MDACRKHSERGQSLVEMAVIVPFLAFIFVGLVEIGWDIYTYMQLLQYTRETARFAIREKVMDFHAADPGYAAVKAHFDEISADRRIIHFTVDGDEPTASMRIQRIEVWAGQPCEQIPCPVNCDALTDDLIYSDDDHIVTFLDDERYKMDYGVETSRYANTLAISEKMRRDETTLACKQEKRDGVVGRGNDAVLVEIVYQKPDLLGIGSIPLYVKTQMRFTYGGPRP